MTGEVQNLKIKLAQAQAKGSDTSSIESKIAAEQKKLDTNIATDTKNAGSPSQGVTGGAAAASTAATATDDDAAATADDAATAASAAAPAASASSSTSTAASQSAASFTALEYVSYALHAT